MFFEEGMLIKKLLSYIQGNKEYGMQFFAGIYKKQDYSE